MIERAQEILLLRIESCTIWYQVKYRIIVQNRFIFPEKIAICAIFSFSIFVDILSSTKWLSSPTIWSVISSHESLARAATFQTQQAEHPSGACSCKCMPFFFTKNNLDFYWSDPGPPWTLSSFLLIRRSTAYIFHIFIA